MLVFSINFSIKFLVNFSVIFSVYLFIHIYYTVYANTYYSYLDKLVKLNNKPLRILQCKTNRSNVLDLYENYNTLPLVQLHQSQCWYLYINLSIIETHYLIIFIIILIINSSVHYATRQKDGWTSSI